MGVLLGGPIVKNRIWFFGNYRRNDYDDKQPDFRAPLTNRDNQLFTKGSFQVSPNNKLEAGILYRRYRNFPCIATASFRNSADARTWMAVEKEQWFINPGWTSVLVMPPRSMCTPAQESISCSPRTRTMTDPLLTAISRPVLSAVATSMRQATTVATVTR